MIGALLFAALLLPACSGGGGPGADRTTVFAAASLAEVFAEIAEEFEAHNPEVTVKLNFAGSQVLRSQLEFGAAADVFAPADVVQMGMVMDGGLVDGDPVIFAKVATGGHSRWQRVRVRKQSGRLGPAGGAAGAGSPGSAGRRVFEAIAGFLICGRWVGVRLQRGGL